ncbi:anhydro-N-acetylmuramic acid kinase [Nonlabens sp. YIK11]|uniref:anhydro-N-acetylmuramic acid kinase n=1 Tax=Nonlabens sp. YIK11 TaxID=1453349 RepID=UPI0006DC3768|nr:anhydro-N-acetylmuramic acid kinase [Nonlabens sp. YIK11]KQC32766.1 anhydro-N-acetylmuramic acid kinase [Nonlabens sp. YIK11]
MKAQNYNVVGVMSGTSLDGIDLVHVNLQYSGKWSFKIIHQDCKNYSLKWKQRLQKGIELNAIDLKQLNLDYTNHLALVIKEFIEDHAIDNLLAICSHGHTISHDPANGHTLQIGNLPQLATLTGHRVVCDFRVQDVQLGGQGAPLVPIGDRLLFSDYEYCLNLGGFANVSYEQNGNRQAYDLCAVNVVLNHYAQKLGKEYDDNGAFAKAGTPQSTILKQLAALPYYDLPAPKSLGIEWVNAYIFPILDQLEDSRDVIATYTQHIAQIISHSLPDHSRVVVTGGGAYNDYLIHLIDHNRAQKLHLPAPEIIDMKEAIIFALLGVLRLRNENNCLASVTGALHDHCGGKIYTP